jgi:tetratricopeptide (TPR) repeat protein
MERNTWSQINDLFEAARHLPVGEREAWVRAATGDEQVRSEVMSLLHAHEDDPWFVDEPGGRRTPARITPAGSWPGRQTPRPAGQTPGQPTPVPPMPPTYGWTPATPSRLHRVPEPKAGGQFGGYRLIRELRREPSRIVFEAVAAAVASHPRVALHVFTADGRDPGFTAILHAQGDILAHLDHPGFARLVDGGVDADGTAYMAFEFAGGDPIDEWCRQHQLSVRDRVNALLPVCDAVQHAHQHLTVHGDLRPANVLMQAGGVVKLLDCGMSIILAVGEPPGGSAAALHPYTSPEQARREVPTAASDVYALGVLLYALLTGYPPYELAGQSPARARQLIGEVEPEMPSTIVGARDRRALAGTLDRIALKALGKQPRERYATVAALAADLRAWLAGRPASVAPPTAWSRLRGGSGHRRSPVGAVMMAGVIAGAGFLGWQAYQMRVERDDARGRLADSERQQREAEAARKANQPGVADLRLEVAARTAAAAADARRGGELPKAEAMWTQALTDLRPLVEANPSDPRTFDAVAGVRSSLGSLCRSLRRFEESLIHYREALRARERAAAVAGAPQGAAYLVADARTSVARLLLDLTEVRPPSRNDAARLREAGVLLQQADAPVRAAAAASPEGKEALAELERQSARQRRLVARRR